MPTDKLTEAWDLYHDVLQAGGCIQCESKGPKANDIWLALIVATNRDPCTTGCPAFKGGACAMYREHSTVLAHAKATKAAEFKAATTPSNGSGEWAGLSMKKIAAKEGISLGEARRRKQRGQYA